MAEKKDSRHRTLTEARKAANKRYIDKFVEVKVRMTPEHRTEVQQHAQEMGTAQRFSSTLRKWMKAPPPSSTERLTKQWLATRNQKRNDDNRNYNEQGSRDLIPDCLFFLNHLKMYERILDGFSLILRALRNSVPLRLRKIIIDPLHNSAFSFDLGDIKV